MIYCTEKIIIAFTDRSTRRSWLVRMRGEGADHLRELARRLFERATEKRQIDGTCDDAQANLQGQPPRLGLYDNARSTGESEREHQEIRARERCAFVALTGFFVFVSLQTAWATFAFVVLVAALVFNAVTLVVIIVVMLRRTDFGRRGGRRKRCATIAALTSR